MTESIPLLKLPRQSRGPPSQDVALKELQENVQHFCNNLTTMERRVRLLNTAQDNSRLRQEIITLTTDTVQLAKIADSAVRKVKQYARSLSPAEKMQFDRLVNTFSSSVSKFQDIQQMTSNLEKELITKARSSSVNRSGSSGNSLPESERENARLVDHDMSSRMSQTQVVVDTDTLAVEQREREMRQLEHDITDINGIFRDLGTLVNDQGDMIDNIEVNVEHTGVKVVAGNKQLEKAVSHKRCSRKLTLCIACFAVTGVVIILIIIISLVCSLGKVCHS
ncbi:syntaxin-7-like isoform X2 [Halichondria panicea]|uniref:syntaxin-7-like isoform X2 n=1 Tax=Halichondria panicea TaxID=6063 RepID=UPI00312B78FD